MNNYSIGTSGLIIRDRGPRNEKNSTRHRLNDADKGSAGVSRVPVRGAVWDYARSRLKCL